MIFRVVAFTTLSLSGAATLASNDPTLGSASRWMLYSTAAASNAVPSLNFMLGCSVTVQTLLPGDGSTEVAMFISVAPVDES